jgi:hypothetical protein
MTSIKDQQFVSNITGKLYRVKKISETGVLLESESGLSQVMTDTETLKLFYRVVQQGPYSFPGDPYGKGEQHGPPGKP